jgi:uncharacterized YigZ family protein
MNNIKTITEPGEAKLREKGSLFIGKAYPAGIEEEIIKILNNIKKKYFDAAHHCYAYKIFPGDSKYSDSGEPSGSAGIRILNAIEHYQLLNILIVVVRYFGGIKLGIGPLGKTYYKSAILTIENSQIVEKIPANKVFLKVDLSFANQVRKIAAANKIQILNTKFEEKMQQEFLVKADKLDQLISRLCESTKNTSEIIVEDKIYFI